MIPLNQSYRRVATFAEYPAIGLLRAAYRERIAPIWPRIGRAFDAAMALYRIDFSGTVVYELAAADSLFGPSLTDRAARVHVSDNFEWPTSKPEEWFPLWQAAAPRPDRLCMDYQDMCRLPYPSGSADVVICLSALEHLRGDQDIAAAAELGRVCRRGGRVVLSIEMGERYVDRLGGCRLYDERALQTRIIGPSGCLLDGPADFAWEAADHALYMGIELASAFFVLVKP